MLRGSGGAFSFLFTFSLLEFMCGAGKAGDLTRCGILWVGGVDSQLMQDSQTII